MYFFKVMESRYGMLAYVLCYVLVVCIVLMWDCRQVVLFNFAVAIVFMVQSPGFVIELLGILALL